jgi:hypothetical protein
MELIPDRCLLGMQSIGRLVYIDKQLQTATVVAIDPDPYFHTVSGRPFDAAFAKEFDKTGFMWVVSPDAKRTNVRHFRTEPFLAGPLFAYAKQAEHLMWHVYGKRELIWIRRKPYSLRRISLE